MSRKADKAKVSTSPADELRREADATLAGLQIGSLTGMFSNTRADWAAIAGGMPKMPLISSSVESMMRSLVGQQAGTAKSFSIAHSERYLGIARQLQAQQLNMAKVFGVSSALTEALQGVRAQQGMFAEALKVHQAVVGTSALASFSESLQIQHGALTKSLATMAASRAQLPIAKLAASSSAAWYKAISAGLNAAGGVSSVSQMLAAGVAMARPLRAYSAFSARTLERLADHGPDSREMGPLARSLEVAQVELMETSVAASDVLRLVYDDVSGPEPRPIRRLNLLTVTQRELLAYDRSTNTLLVDEGLLVSVAEKAAAKCRSVQSLLILCNETGAASSNRRVFKLTDRVGTALADLPWLIPTTRHQLSEFLTLLYFALYEGAGGTSLRYRDSDLLSDSECEFIWHLKHLRNKWLLHDIEHGAQRDIRASQARLRESLEFFGLSHIPANAADFRALHRAILNQAERFLQLLLSRLQRPVD
jgi:hypothetical protein